MRRLFRTSRWLHKYVGLVLILFCIWMGGSGILINHPHLIRNIAVPAWLVPPQYHVRDWSRGALRCAVFSRRDARVGYVGGILGVWRTDDGGRTFEPMREGFPQSYIERQVASLVLDERTAGDRLFAATRGGLYVCDLRTGRWRRVTLENEQVVPWEHRAVLRLVRVGDDLLALTDSHVYRASLADRPPVFADVTPARVGDGPRRVSLVKLFFDLHDGKVWGLAGRLLFDLMGLAIVFLSVSAFYVWYAPWRSRRRNAPNPPTLPRPHLYRWMVKYHFKIGIWTAAVLLVIGSTAVFMRPPLIALLADGAVPRAAYPGRLPDNPWHERIHNALYDPVAQTLLIETTDDGFWRGPADFSRPFARADFRAPIFVMGTTVLEPYGQGGFLVGSFSGIFHVERDTGRAIDLVSGRPAGHVSRFRPASLMADGFLRLPDGDEFVATHHRGLIPLAGVRREGRFPMPVEMAREFRLPLWNYMFELHNGRIFRDLVGVFYALIAPLGSILFVLITLTGIYDWCYLKLTSHRHNQPESSPADPRER